MKISDLPEAKSLTMDSIIPIVQNGATHKISLANLPVYLNNLFDSTQDTINSHWQKLIREFLSPPSINKLESKIKNNTGFPKIDSYFTENTYNIEVALPGVEFEDIDVEVFDQGDSKFISISGNLKQIEGNLKFQWRELKRGNFSRNEILPDNIQGDVVAVFNNGLLKLTWNLKNIKKNSKKVKISSE